MTIELTKINLWHLIRGLEPPTYEWVFKLQELGLGSYIGGLSDSFSYNSTRFVPELSESELWELYQAMKADHDKVLARFESPSV